MAFVREYTQYVTTAGDALPHPITMNTPDGFQTQTLTHIWVGSTTVGVEIGVVISGDQKINVDCGYFAVADKEIPFDVVAPIGIQPVVVITDHTGTGLTDIPITLTYKVDQG